MKSKGCSVKPKKLREWWAVAYAVGEIEAFTSESYAKAFARTLGRAAFLVREVPQPKAKRSKKR